MSIFESVLFALLFAEGISQNVLGNKQQNYINSCNDLSNNYDQKVIMSSNAATKEDRPKVLNPEDPLRLPRGEFTHLYSKIFGKQANGIGITGARKLSKREVKANFKFQNPEKPPRQTIMDICGRRVETAATVINGLPTYVGEHPWLTAMFHYQHGAYKFRCAGNIITRSHVITAGHCFSSKDSQRLIVFAFGKHNIDNWQTEAVVRGVEKFNVHHDYKKPGDADVAIVKLDIPLEFGVTIRPICLWDEPDDGVFMDGEYGMVAGWGRDETGKIVSELKKVNMKIVPQLTCINSDARFLKVTSNRTFCAGNGNGSAPCTADSGGGFIMKRDGRWRLRGLVSTGLVHAGTCDPHQYVVFVDVAKFRSWIISYLGTEYNEDFIFIDMDQSR